MGPVHFCVRYFCALVSEENHADLVVQLALMCGLDLLFPFVIRDAENECVFHLFHLTLPTLCV